MKLMLPLCLVLFGTGCSQTASRGVSNPGALAGQHASAYESNYDRYSRIKSSAAIDQRAKHFEQEGLTPEYARAAAEIEHAKSGR
jgi:hypothetical protein